MILRVMLLVLVPLVPSVGIESSVATGEPLSEDGAVDGRTASDTEKPTGEPLISSEDWVEDILKELRKPLPPEFETKPSESTVREELYTYNRKSCLLIHVAAEFSERQTASLLKALVSGYLRQLEMSDDSPEMRFRLERLVKRDSEERKNYYRRHMGYCFRDEMEKLFFMFGKR